MKDLTKEIEATPVPRGSVALWWLAQAGFAFKTGAGTRVYLDPYLSDGVEKAFGFKRLSLAPIDAAAVRADWLVSSHEHLDHLDLDSLPAIAANCPRCRFAGPRPCSAGYEQCGIAPSRRVLLEAGRTVALDDIRVRCVKADHGTLSEDALALLLDFGEVRVFFTGDTAPRIDGFRPLFEPRPDVVLPCINGAFGNMDAREAARLCAALSPRLAIPCHFWMFPEHGGDPAAFLKACASESPAVKARLLGPGEGLIVTAEDVRPAASRAF